eukprot:3680917-Prymnesium_polylepis.1
MLWRRGGMQSAVAGGRWAAPPLGWVRARWAMRVVVTLMGAWRGFSRVQFALFAPAEGASAACPMPERAKEF